MTERVDAIRVEAGPETVHWGYFDAQQASIASIDSGETIVMSTVSGGPETLPGPPHCVPEALRAIHAAMSPALPGHICTGPVAVRGAKAGDVLEVRIRDIGFHYDWGYTTVKPQAGALPDDFDAVHLFHTRIDAARGVGILP